MVAALVIVIGLYCGFIVLDLFVLDPFVPVDKNGDTAHTSETVQESNPVDTVDERGDTAHTLETVQDIKPDDTVDIVDFGTILVEWSDTTDIPIGYYATDVFPEYENTTTGLNDFLRTFRQPKEYIAHEFDCSEMSACLEWALEDAGFDASIAQGPDHAWVIVYIDGMRVAIEATSSDIAKRGIVSSSERDYYNPEGCYDGIHECVESQTDELVAVMRDSFDDLRERELNIRRQERKLGLEPAYLVSADELEQDFRQEMRRPVLGEYDWWNSL